VLHPSYNDSRDDRILEVALSLYVGPCERSVTVVGRSSSPAVSQPLSCTIPGPSVIGHRSTRPKMRAQGTRPGAFSSGVASDEADPARTPAFATPITATSREARSIGSLATTGSSSRRAQRRSRDGPSRSIKEDVEFPRGRVSI
jgi:hypothetical protein